MHAQSSFISPIVLSIGKSNAPYDTHYYRYVTGTFDHNNNNIMMIEHIHTNARFMDDINLKNLLTIQFSHA